MIRIFNIFIPVRTLILFLLEGVLIAGSYLLAAAILLDIINLEMFLLYEGGMRNIGILTATMLIVMYVLNLYAPVRQRSRVQLGIRLIQVIGLAFMFEGLFTYLQCALPPNIMFAGSVVVLPVLGGSRLIYNSLSKRFGTDRVLFVGVSPQAVEIAARMAELPDLGFTLIGIVDDEMRPGDLWQGVKVLGRLADLGEAARSIALDRVALFLPERRKVAPLATLLDLHFSGVRVEDGSVLYETVCGRISMEQLRPSDLIFHNTVGPRPNNVALQSIYTNLIALCLFAALLPFLPIVALAIKLTSRGPVFKRETRLGFRGVPFTMFRFRCDAVEDGCRRFTRVGYWLRRFHLENLPQLWNVVRGEMALIGPRPERKEFLRIIGQVIPFFAQKQCVKPGMTGWSQINSTDEQAIDTVRTLEYDLYYIKNISLALDAYIILQALKSVRSRP